MAGDFVATSRAKRFVNQSSTTKKLSDYQKSKLVRAIARILNEFYREGIAEGKRRAVDIGLN